MSNYKEFFLSYMQAMHNQTHLKSCNSPLTFDQKEIDVLRKLAGQVAEIAQRDEMKTKRELWTKHNDLKSKQPVVFVDAEAGWHEIFPWDEFECTDPLARTWEYEFKRKIFLADKIKDDSVITADFDVPYAYSDDGWGIDQKVEGNGDYSSAYHISSAISDYEEDFGKLHFPTITIDWEMSNRVLEYAQKLFGDLLNVRRHQKWHWAEDGVNFIVQLRGMEDFMCDFILNPEWIDKMMGFMYEGMNKRLDWLEENNLLHLNNGADYVGTGGWGFTDELPASGNNGKVLTQDLWGLFQAQETVSINPDMFGEFILPYYKKMGKRFGRICYGCCEPFNPRWKYVKQIPNLHKVSVSPWADYSTVPELLGNDYIASVKLKPTPLAMHNMDEDVVRKYCREAVEKTYGGCCEFLMKDTHTIGKNPDNLIRWTQIMREEIEKVY